MSTRTALNTILQFWPSVQTKAECPSKPDPLKWRNLETVTSSVCPKSFFKMFETENNSVNISMHKNRERNFTCVCSLHFAGHDVDMAQIGFLN